MSRFPGCTTDRPTRDSYGGQAAVHTEGGQARGMIPAVSLRAASRALLLTLAALLTFTSVAAADRGFSARFSTNDTGDIAGIANTLMTCPAGSSSGSVSCATTQSVGPTATANVSYNNNYDMTYVDVDADATTFNSSTGNQSLPAGAEVLFAGLYWGGDFSTGTAAAPNASARNVAKLRLPGSATYLNLTADTVDDSTLNVGRYQAFKDVTSLVRALPNAGNGTYGVANVQAGKGGDRYAGWTLIVAYRDTTAPARNLTVFDGLRTIRTTDPPTDIPVSGFLTPPAGQVKTEIGFVTWEGDHGLVGDSASLNGNVLSDAQHPATNFFNSRISRDGVLYTDRNPAYANALGMDSSFTPADGFVGNNATSATIRVTTSGDQYLPGVITFATEIYAPKIEQTKTVSDLNGGDVEQGDILEYTVSGVNSGQDGTAGFVLRDPIPANSTYVPGSIVLGGTSTTAGAATDASGDDRAEYDAANGRVVARLGTGASATQGGNVAPTRTYSLKFKVRVNGPALADNPVPAGTRIDNTATASFFSQTTNTPLGATASVSSTVRSPDLRIAKTRTGGPIVGGGSNTYRLAVDNVGNAKSQGLVAVSDTLPAGVTPTAATGTGWACSIVGRTVTCTRSDSLAAGQPYPDITLGVDIDGGVSGNVSNTATVSGGGDALLGNNSSTDTSPSSQSADLALTKTADKPSVKIGENVVFTLTATNNGPSTATSVTITDALPTGLQFVGSTPACTIEPVSGTLSCPVGTLARNATKTVEITAKAMASAATTTVKNTATVAGQQTDPTPANNTAEASVAVAGADLKVTKTLDGPAAPRTGDVVTYTVEVKNLGASDATGVVLLDALPAGLANVTTDGGSACTVAGTQLTCTVGAVAAGETYTVKVTGTVKPNQTSLVNAASAQGNEADPNTADNSDQVTTPVAPAADLKVVKSADPAQVSPGDQLSYFFVTTNSGPDTADGVTVTDVLPAGVTYVTGAPGCTEAAGTVTCTYAQPILPGTSRQTGFTVKVSDGASGTIRNTATVDSPVYDPDTSNNTDTIDTTVLDIADVTVTKTTSEDQPQSGDTVTFTLTARNAGPGTARDVVLADTLPAGLTLVDADAPCTTTAGVVRCDLGTLAAGGERGVTLRATVDPIVVARPGASHALDVQKVEAQMDLEPGQEREVKVSCPSGYLALDGSVRIDAVDQGTGTLGSPIVLSSYGNGPSTWAGVVRNEATGRAQAKVFSVCVREQTSTDDGHAHDLVMSEPIYATQTLLAGSHDVTIACGPGRTPVQPSFEADGEIRLSRSSPSGDDWTFRIDVEEGATVAVAVRCLDRQVSAVDGHTHDLGLQLLKETVTVPAGQVTEAQLTCADDAKGIVGGYDLGPGLFSLGNDPRPKTRAFKLYNPTGGDLQADLTLLCLSGRTGGEKATLTITNTADVTTSTRETDATNNQGAVTLAARNSDRPAPVPDPVAPSAPAPAPAADTPPAPASAPAAPAAPAAGTVTLATTRVQVTGTTATTTVRCAGRATCRGTVRLVASRTQRLAGKLVRKGTVLATATYTLRAGRTAKLRLRPTAVGRRALRSTSLRTARIRLGSAERTVSIRR